MTDLKSFAIFAEVVASGSMSAAARQLGLTPSAISQTMTGLERQFGVTLLHRSTRRITLTEAGERCYAHCRRLVDAANAAAASLEQARDAPTGELRIAAPVGFGAHVAPALAPALAEWRDLRLQLIVDDEMVDLTRERVDLSLRVGKLGDSPWVGRKLCDLEPVLCASPSYLERHGRPETIEELHRHDWLGLIRDGSRSASGRHPSDVPTFALEVMRQDGLPDTVALPLRTTTNNQIALQQMCEQGMGIARLFYVDVRSALELGALVRVLPKQSLPRQPLTLMRPNRDRDPAKVRVALTALTRYFETLPSPS